MIFACNSTSATPKREKSVATSKKREEETRGARSGKKHQERPEYTSTYVSRKEEEEEEEEKSVSNSCVTKTFLLVGARPLLPKRDTPRPLLPLQSLGAATATTRRHTKKKYTHMKREEKRLQSNVLPLKHFFWNSFYKFGVGGGRGGVIIGARICASNDPRSLGVSLPSTLRHSPGDDASPPRAAAPGRRARPPRPPLSPADGRRVSMPEGDARAPGADHVTARVARRSPHLQSNLHSSVSGGGGGTL